MPERSWRVPALIVAVLLVPGLAEGRAAVKEKRFRYLAPKGASRARPEHPTPPPLIPLPPVRQHSEAACGPACLQSVLAYYGRPSRRASQLVQRGGSGYTYADGTTEATFARLARGEGLKVETRARMGMGELVRHLSNGRPVAVGIQAWTERRGPVDWRREECSGHYVVAIGLGDARGRALRGSTRRLLERNDVFIWFMDPAADFGNRGYLPLREFMDRWHWQGDNGPTHRYGMVFRGAPKQTSFVDGVERIR
jgi:hypothetical protein